MGNNVGTEARFSVHGYTNLASSFVDEIRQDIEDAVSRLSPW
jgi:hypothetical protein